VGNDCDNGLGRPVERCKCIRKCLLLAEIGEESGLCIWSVIYQREKNGAA